MCCSTCEQKRGRVKSASRGIKALRHQGIDWMLRPLRRCTAVASYASAVALSFRRFTLCLSMLAIVWAGAIGCATSQNVTSWKPTRIPKQRPSTTQNTQGDLLDELDEPPRTIWCLLPTGRPNEYRWVEVQQ